MRMDRTKRDSLVRTLTLMPIKNQSPRYLNVAEGFITAKFPVFVDDIIL